MNRKAAKILWAVGLMLVFLIPVGTVWGQAKPADNTQILIEKMKADKKLLVAENLQLTEAESKAFWPVYQKYQSELFLIRVRTAELIANYAAVYNKMTDSAANKLLDESLKIETLRLELAKAYLPQFRKVLPAAKAARYYQIENKINALLYYELAAGIPLVKTEK